MIEKVLISDDLINFLERRNLDKQYKKAKNYLLDGYFEKIRFKLKEPKKDGIYYFRINIQFRALCKLEGNILKVFDIDNHQ
ncbi:MAG: hypothetical protein Q9M94_00610 [Candidatus Gracilibacteria bacterium]|nr:hypothetical protein [Candidatus Gracilibacteria bacterium]